MELPAQTSTKPYQFISKIISKVQLSTQPTQTVSKISVATLFQPTVVTQTTTTEGPVSASLKLMNPSTVSATSTTEATSVTSTTAQPLTTSTAIVQLKMKTTKNTLHTEVEGVGTTTSVGTLAVFTIPDKQTSLKQTSDNFEPFQNFVHQPTTTRKTTPSNENTQTLQTSNTTSDSLTSTLNPNHRIHERLETTYTEISTTFNTLSTKLLASATTQTAHGEHTRHTNIPDSMKINLTKKIPQQENVTADITMNVETNHIDMGINSTDDKQLQRGESEHP